MTCGCATNVAPLTLQVKLNHPDAKVPQKQSPLAAGYDLFRFV